MHEFLQQTFQSIFIIGMRQKNWLRLVFLQTLLSFNPSSLLECVKSFCQNDTPQYILSFQSIFIIGMRQKSANKAVELSEMGFQSIFIIGMRQKTK